MLWEQIINTYSTKFGLLVDNSLSWNKHIDQLMSKLRTVCYAIRYIKLFITQETLRMIYFSYIHSILTYDIIYWGKSSYCNNIFKIKKNN